MTTRINTNVSSLVAQTALARSNTQLQQSLTRLSTGLRINSGKDDPAGLIASESLGSDIISVQKAIGNSQAANQLISTADSALGQVSSLLNDIRGLVSQSANTGALSSDQIAANQLQVDSSLDAIDRISQTTAFQGRKLLDGNLDFVSTSAGTYNTTHAAGTFGSIAQVNASLAVGSGANGTVTFTAKTAGGASGTAGNAYTISYVSGATAGAETVTFDGAAKTLVIGVDDTAGTGSTATQVAAALAANASASAAFSAVASGTGSSVVAASAAASAAGGVDSNQLTLTAVNTGVKYNNLKVTLATGVAAGSETAAYDSASNTLTVNVNDTSTAAQVLTAVNTEGTFTAASLGNGGGVYSAGTTASVTTGATVGPQNISNLAINQANFGTSNSIGVNVNIDAQATQGKLTYSGGTLTSDLVLQVAGNKGAQVFNFGSGTTVAQINTAINSSSDSTGVTASVVSGNVVLNSSDYGKSAAVSARAVSGTFDTVDAGGSASTRSTGTDISLRINGVKATGDGLKASLHTSSLDLNFSVEKTHASNDTFSFNITSGGANFQLGPSVVSNQQARVGIQGVNTATLGGIDGKLYQLRSGADKSLTNDVNGAAKIVDEVISQVTSLRGRLGAFQKTTLDTNIATLNDTVANLTDARSSIRDADFAAESANLSRAQILVQSGTQVLQISNQNPQQVLSLLRGA